MHSQSNDSSRDRKWTSGSLIHIRKRTYRIVKELGVWYRPRYLVFDLGSRCHRLVMRLERGDVSRQHLQVLRRIPRCNTLPEIIDSEFLSNEHLVVTTWLDGVDLGDYLERVRRGVASQPSCYEVVRLIRGLAHGMLRLHQHAQLIHADIKPQNLVLTRKPARLAMIDFGSAWQIERTSTRLEGDGSQPVFAAPEILNGDDRVDGRADQFSASMVMYQLLSGRVAYDGLGGQAGLHQFRKQIEPLESVLLCDSVKRLPRRLQVEVNAIVSRSLELDAAKRFPTTNAWVDALESLYLTLKSQSFDQPPTRWIRCVDWMSSVVAILSSSKEKSNG